MLASEDFENFVLLLCVSICRVLSLLVVLIGPLTLVFQYLFFPPELKYLSFFDNLVALGCMLIYTVPAGIILYGLSIVFDRFRKKYS